MSPSGSASLQKLTIRHETTQPRIYDGTVVALFNPDHLKYAKEVSWDVSPTSGISVLASHHRVNFNESKPRTLSVELFFDTYEGPPVAPGGSGLSLAQSVGALVPDNPLDMQPSGVDVTRYSGAIVSLATIWQELHRPPRCKLLWGRKYLLHGVLTSLSEDYTLFIANGTPVRATLGCTFTETAESSDGAASNELHSSDVFKQHVVIQGETLSSIAQAQYNDSSQWRAIARANHIDDPRCEIKPGMALLIPALDEGT